MEAVVHCRERIQVASRKRLVDGDVGRLHLTKFRRIWR
ncbi:MAG: hypothetical protein QOD93_1443, partial [Acetobacteraceae bacterium]|nr:hypothetical protein [Acetobacteraceae bacterium]